MRLQKCCIIIRGGVKGLCLNKKYITQEKTATYPLPVYAIENEIEKYGAANIGVYISVAYRKMNQDRAFIYHWLKGQGITILSYIHPSCVADQSVNMGEGNIVLEGTIIQPFVNIGNCNIIWSNVSLCHHSTIGSFNYFSPSATIAGRVKIGNNCFVGAGSTLKNDICLGDKVLIGAGAYISRSLEDDTVFVPERGHVLDKKSRDIFIE